MGEDCRKFVKHFLILALNEEVYTRPRETQDGNSLEVTNARLPKVDWYSLVYGDDFFHSYKPVPWTFNMDWKSFPGCPLLVNFGFSSFVVMLKCYCYFFITFPFV